MDSGTIGSGTEVLKGLDAGKIALFTHALEQLGWDLVACDLNEVAQTFRLEIRRGDLHILLDARQNKVMLEREIIVPQSTTQRYGAIWARHFLGRQKAEGMRHGLKMLAGYLVDNGAPKLEAQNTVLMLMGGDTGNG